jgi:hypothetical protein
VLSILSRETGISRLSKSGQTIPGIAIEKKSRKLVVETIFI